MIKLAINGIPYFDVDDFELKRNEVSYTINTINYLKEKFNDIDLIIGYDNLQKFPLWKDPDEIMSKVNLVILHRIVEDATYNKYYDNAIFVKSPILDISATDIRERIKKKLSIDFLVPEKVKEYIYKHNLYISD